jgi:hypothetical protein
LLWVRLVVRVKWSEGIDVVTSNCDGPLGDVVVGANGVDALHGRVVASKFTAKGVAFFDRTRDQGVAQESVVGIIAFQNCGGSAESRVKGGITHSNSESLKNSLGNVEAVVVNGGMLDSPVGRLGEGL